MKYNVDSLNYYRDAIPWSTAYSTFAGFGPTTPWRQQFLLPVPDTGSRMCDLVLPPSAQPEVPGISAERCPMPPSITYSAVARPGSSTPRRRHFFWTGPSYRSPSYTYVYFFSFFFFILNLYCVFESVACRYECVFYLLSIFVNVLAKKEPLYLSPVYLLYFPDLVLEKNLHRICGMSVSSRFLCVVLSLYRLYSVTYLCHKTACLNKNYLSRVKI